MKFELRISNSREVAGRNLIDLLTSFDPFLSSKAQPVKKTGRKLPRNRKLRSLFHCYNRHVLCVTAFSCSAVCRVYFYVSRLNSTNKARCALINAAITPPVVTCSRSIAEFQL
jgi:hypothetical protein